MSYTGSRTVTDRFSLRNLVRRYTPQNGRNYILKTVSDHINSPVAREHIELGQMYGYYGHGRREVYYNEHKTLRLPEFAIVMVNGEKVELNNVPAARTLDIKLDGDIVTHTQEILNTPPGGIVDALESGNVGGWSWAMTGVEYGAMAEATGYEGMDYVTTPNFISVDKRIAMMESAESREAAIIEQCKQRGFNDNTAVDIAQHFERMRSEALFESSPAFVSELRGELTTLAGAFNHLNHDHQETVALLEAARLQEITRSAAQVAFLDSLPVLLGKTHRDAIKSLNTPEDFEVLRILLESVKQPLPQTTTIPLTATSEPAKKAPSAPVFFSGGKAVPRFGK